MKKILAFILGCIIITLSASCGTIPEVTEENGAKDESEQLEETVSNNVETPYEVVYKEAFQIFDPYAEVFDDELLASIGADGFSGTDAEIAQDIYDWQKENMYYVNDPNNQIDASYPGRWNMFLPGIYPASEMVEERVTADGRIYGICFDYAMIFCAIANSYGLESRVSYFTTYKFSEANDWVDPATTRGLSVDEYNELNKKMSAHGLNLSYDQVDRVARESFIHARAEVKLDGEWVPFDAVPSVTGDFLQAENYEALPYTYGYSNVLLYAPPTMENNKLNIHALAEILSYCPQIEYNGRTDDAGNESRAASYIDLTRGLGLVPYYKDPLKIIDFLQLPEGQAEEILDDVFEVAQEYEEGTGKPFYVIADFLIYGDEEEMNSSDYVFLYNAITGAELTESEFNEYIK